MPSTVTTSDQPAGAGRRWSAQPNDLAGGWAVTNLPVPLSAHDMRPDGDPALRGYVFAECAREDDARLLAALLNAGAVRRAQDG